MYLEVFLNINYKEFTLKKQELKIIYYFFITYYNIF